MKVLEFYANERYPDHESQDISDHSSRSRFKIQNHQQDNEPITDIIKKPDKKKSTGGILKNANREKLE